MDFGDSGRDKVSRVRVPTILDLEQRMDVSVNAKDNEYFKALYSLLLTYIHLNIPPNEALLYCPNGSYLLVWLREFVNSYTKYRRPNLRSIVGIAENWILSHNANDHIMEGNQSNSATPTVFEVSDSSANSNAMALFDEFWNTADDTEDQYDYANR